MTEPRGSGTARGLTLGTRGSALARWQTNWVIDLLRRSWPELECRVVEMATAGDRNIDQPLAEIGGKGLFTQALEDALRSGQIDLAVHSLKDLPTSDADGLTLGAIPRRADARDALIAPRAESLALLPAGARLGTSSPRRAAQLRLARPDLDIQPVRGNVDTRVRKVQSGEYDAILLAMAGLQRLGLDGVITEVLSLDVMLPAPGQGALAAQCRADDAHCLRLLAALNHAPTRGAVTAERAFLAGLGGGCAVPVAAYARAGAYGRLYLSGLVAALDGSRAVRVSGDGPEPHALGLELARQALEQGARELLA